MATRLQLLIPALVLVAIVVAAFRLIAVASSSFRADSAGESRASARASARSNPAAPSALNRIWDADRYVDELSDALLESHPYLEGVSKEEFAARAVDALRRVIADSPAAVARAGIDASLPDPPPEWSALTASWLGKGNGDADPRIDARVDLLAGALLEAVGDPFTRRIRGDHFLDVSLILRLQFPTEVGVFLDRDADGVYVRAVMRETDAAAKGVRCGDRVLAIDGERAEGSTLRALEDKVARPCRLTLAREGFAEPVELALFAFDPRRFGVRACWIDESIGYLTFSSFSGSTFANLLQMGRRLVKKGARAILLDLRGNPGGLIAEAVAIANLFLPRDVLVAHVVERGEKHRLPPEIASTTPAFGAEIPLVLLVDRSSASASELLSAALKENRRALLVGETTFGKGIGQIIQPLLLGHGRGSDSRELPRSDLLVLTSLRILSPGGNDFHGIGIDPDVVATAPPESRARLLARAELLEDARVVEALAALELSPRELLDLRRPGPPPARLLAAVAGVRRLGESDDERAALKDVARHLFSPSHPLLLACPELDPVLAKAVTAARLALRQTTPR